jgi:hypothetical protein
MKVNPISVSALKWANPEHTAIDMTVRFAEINEDLPFTASPSDSEEHSRALFAAAVAGDYGVVAEYDGPIYPEPDPNPPEPPVLGITPLQFIDRFTDEEQLAIVSATMTNPVVKLWYDKLLAAQEVVFADPRLSVGLDGLVAAGLITAERKAEILPEAQTSGVTVL